MRHRPPPTTISCPVMNTASSVDMPAKQPHLFFLRSGKDDEAIPPAARNEIAIRRLDGFVSPKASICECMVSSSPTECPAPGTH